MRPYKTIIAVCKLKKNEDETALIPDVPFRVYGYNFVCEGKSLTHRLHDLKNDGKEVLARLSYRCIDMPGTDVIDESEKAEKFAGKLGCEFKEVVKSASYIKHYNRKKEDALATYDSEGTKVPYDGADKDELVPFCLWDGQVKAKAVEIGEVVTPVIR